MKKNTVKDKNKEGEKLKNSKEGFTLETYQAMENFIFSKYMAGEGNETQQRKFLEILGITIKGNISQIDSKIPPDIDGKKSSRFDCHLKTSCGKKINIEVQQRKTKDFKNRLVHYLSKTLTSSLNKGDDYNFSNKAIGIAICNFSLLKSPSYHTIFTINNNNPNSNEQFTDILEIHIIEIPKFRQLPIYKKIRKYLKNKNQKEYTNITKEFQYLLFLNNETSHKERKEIVKMGDKGLNIALKKIEEALQDEDAYNIFLEQKIEEIHQKNMIKEKEEKGIKKGRKEGIEKGREEEKIEIAIKLKNKGISIEDIAETTCLNPEFIKKL